MDNEHGFPEISTALKDCLKKQELLRKMLLKDALYREGTDTLYGDTFQPLRKAQENIYGHVTQCGYIINLSLG